ncbi:NAD(P)-dependent oxidoreductase (plasmid) [Mesorhizobium sp. ORM8.1]
MLKQIGLVGLGNIGFHFAVRLLAAGHNITVFDLKRDVVERLVAKGASVASDLADMTRKVDILLLSLPLPAAVLSVAQQVAASGKVRVVVDLSTTGPAATMQVASCLEERGIAFLGAPVSGGLAAAEKGTLAVMASGPEAVFKEVGPLLCVLGKNIFYLGADPALGQTMKVINNTLYAATMIASCEALVFGTKAGLSPTVMLNVLNASSGRSYATQERIPPSVLDRSFPLRFATDLLYKDIKLCLDEAERLGAAMPVSQAMRQFLAFAISQGDGPKDNVYPIRHLEHWAGVTVAETMPPYEKAAQDGPGARSSQRS